MVCWFVSLRIVSTAVMDEQPSQSSLHDCDSSGSNRERFLLADDGGVDGWRGEALAVISDIRAFVNSVEISLLLPCDCSGIYINLETKELKKITVELSRAGFRICGSAFDSLDLTRDTVDADGPTWFETPYALLDTISPGYRASFSGALADKLSQLEALSQKAPL
jgi:hypothetical protein